MVSFVLRAERYAVAKVAKVPDEFFAIINDGREITAIVKETQLDELNVIDVERGFRILTYSGVLEFNVVGFIATIAVAMAKRGVPIFVISAYSTDHILVRDHDVSKAIEALRELGFEISWDR